jgi:hypothetical protein
VVATVVARRGVAGSHIHLLGRSLDRVRASHPSPSFAEYWMNYIS